VKIEMFLLGLKRRVKVHDVIFAQGKWWLWFIPGDGDLDIKSADLD
jgi:hypothetical protein